MLEDRRTGDRQTMGRRRVAVNGLIPSNEVVVCRCGTIDRRGARSLRDTLQTNDIIPFNEVQHIEYRLMVNIS